MTCPMCKTPLGTDNEELCGECIAGIEERIAAAKENVRWSPWAASKVPLEPRVPRVYSLGTIGCEDE